MKKNYMKPTMRFLALQHQSRMLSISNATMRSLNSNLDDDNDEVSDLIWGGGNSSTAR